MGHHFPYHRFGSQFFRDPDLELLSIIRTDSGFTCSSCDRPVFFPQDDVWVFGPAHWLDQVEARCLFHGMTKLDALPLRLHVWGWSESDPADAICTECARCSACDATPGQLHAADCVVSMPGERV